MPRAIVGIGGNLGPRRAIFACAETLLAAEPGCSVEARSRLYATKPLGPPQPDYLNAALALAWVGDAPRLMHVLRSVEQLLGRVRRERWGPRTLDLDLLHWSAGPIQQPGLVVPHAGLVERAFALAPLLDVAPDLDPLYASRLAELGGPPPLAQPGWLGSSDPGAPPLTRDPEVLRAHAALLVSTVAQGRERG